jgi:hypothetical protein
MKRIDVIATLTAASFLLAGSTAQGQFAGEFSGQYTPEAWSRQVYGNPLYQDTAFVYAGNAPASLEIDGAVDSLQQVQTPQLPVSVIDYTITLGGDSLQPVTFNYSFLGQPDGYDAAALIYDNGSGLQVVADLSTLLDGTQQTYFNNTSFQGGHTFGFRVYSNNDNLADVLVISAVPEPSALTLLVLGASLFCRKLLGRRARR